QRAAAAAQNSYLGTGGSAHRLRNRSGWVEHGHHAIFDMERFRQLRGYKAELSEDPEFDQRLIKSGGRIWLADDLTITYFPRGNTNSLFWQYMIHGRERARTFIQHVGRKRIRHLILPSVAPIVGIGIFEPFYLPFVLHG